MFLCQYHLIISTYVGNIKADPAFCKRIIDESLEVYPSSCIFMILNARYFLVIVSIQSRAMNMLMLTLKFLQIFGRLTSSKLSSGTQMP